MMCDRNQLAVIARAEAEKPYNGKLNHCAPNIQDIVARFPNWSVEEANGLWCAAFVYHCVISAGFKIPVRPKESSCSLAGCIAWEEWAKADSRVGYHVENISRILERKKNRHIRAYIRIPDQYSY